MVLKVKISDTPFKNKKKDIFTDPFFKSETKLIIKPMAEKLKL